MTVDYQQAALDVMSGATPPPDAPPVEPAPVVGEDAKEVVVPPPAPASSEPVMSAAAYEQLLREKVQLESKIKDAEGFLQAKEAKDPLKTLHAGGFTYRQLYQQLVDLENKGLLDEEGNLVDGALEAAASGSEGLPPALDQRLKSVESTIESEQRERAISGINQFVASNEKEFLLVSKLGLADQTLSFLETYYQKHKSLPAPDWETSVRMALTSLESHLSGQMEQYLNIADTYLKLRYPELAEASKPPVETIQRSSPPSFLSVKKTLSNASAAPSLPSTPGPKSESDYRQAALAALESAWQNRT